MNILILLYVSSILSLAWIYGGYFLFIYILSRIFEKKYAINESFAPSVTLVIPTYNEEIVIEKKIKDILGHDYPREKLQIIIVDSASVDKTRQLVRQYSSLGVELLEQPERMGKASAIIHALKSARNDLIVVTDANSYFKPGTLRHLLKHFSHPCVGAATGRYTLKESIENTGPVGSVLFREYENILREYEAKFDSAVSIFGELFAARKDSFSNDMNNLNEDFDSSIYIRAKGLRLIYEPRAEVYEIAPSSRKDIIMRKRNVIIGTIQNLFKYRGMLFNPKYGFYGTIILPGHKLFPVLSPLFLTVFLVLSVIFWKSAFFYILLGLIVIAITLLIKPRVLLNFPQSLKYVIDLNLACVLAWKDYLCGNYSVKWEKIESNRI